MNARFFTTSSLIVTLTLLAGVSGAQAPRPQPWRADDPPAPQQQGQNVVLEGQIGGSTDAVAIKGQYAYVGGARLVVLDIGDPADPAFVGQTDPLPGVAFDVAVAGNHAFVAAFISGLRIIDISNPAEPFEVACYETGGNPQGVAMVGGYAYVVDLFTGLWIIDVSDPEAPAGVGSYQAFGEAQAVALSGHYAYLGYSGLRVVDISDPSAPFEAGYHRPPLHAVGVAAAGSCAYVATWDAGLMILRYVPPNYSVYLSLILRNE